MPYEQYTSPRGLGAVALRASGLGVVIGIHVVWLVQAWYSSWSYGDWAGYVTALATWHLGEFLICARNNPWDVSIEQFMLNHSKPYIFAISGSAIEYWAWQMTGFSAPQAWTSTILAMRVIAVLLCALGVALRWGAMWTAGSSFHHEVQTEKRHTHRLITHGPYRWSRHPSYVGWWWWSVAGQAALGNPFCTVLFAGAATRFFADRVRFEEIALVSMFGDAYIQYAKRTPTWIPGAAGHDFNQQASTDASHAEAMASCN